MENIPQSDVRPQSKIKPQNEVKAKTLNENQNRNEPNELEDNAITNILSCQLSRDKIQDLDIRKITFDHPDKKYLISCAESGVKEDIRIFLWSLEKILVGFTDPEDIVLKVEERPLKEKKIANWLLSIDAITTEIKGNKKWIVCAGSIHGDVYVWLGDIDKRKNTWILKDHSFHNFKKDMEKEKAVFDIKVRKDLASNNNTLNIYLALNDIYEISQKPLRDNFIRKLQLEFDESGGKLKLSNNESDFEKQEEWILSFDLYVKKEKNILITGSKDKEIRIWDVEKGTSKLIGKHDDAISCVKIFNNGRRVASGCLDNVIKVWDLEGEPKDNNEPLRTFTKHKGEIVSLDIQKGDEYLVSASKDNTIKIWDLDNSAMIYNIDINPAIKKYKNNKKTQATDELEIHGLDFLRQVLISPKNRFIFVVKKNNIIILRNFGKVWHFIQQLEKIEKTRLYENIFGENLKQIAENGDEDEDILEDIYKEIIKKREPNVSELGSLFIPAFIKYEDEIKSQREYIASVKTNYKNYWFSAKKLFFQLPTLPWKFKLHLTTEIKEDIKMAEFKEIGKIPTFNLEDRKQSQIRFLMELVNVPTTFIPLIKAINLDIEDDRGDKDKLIFSDFTYEDNFINSSDGGKFYYSDCVFKLDQRYAYEKRAVISIRKITVEFTESLDPSLTNYPSPKNREYIELFEAFRNKFQSPILPKIPIKIGTKVSAVGKMMDNYLSKFVLIEFIFTAINIILVFIKWETIGTIDVSFYIIGTILMGLILVFSIHYDLKRRKKMEKKESKKDEKQEKKKDEKKEKKSKNSSETQNIEKKEE